MGALNCFENSLKKDPSAEQQKIALFNATCVHANFGDVELAQVSLREAVLAGLDFEAAISEPDDQMLKMVAPTQIILQLKRFGASVGQKKKSSNLVQNVASTSDQSQENPEDELFSTEIRGMDASVLGIIRRVLFLLVALTIFGVGLFYLGLAYLFPE
eukprot:TRINITY_DN22452_c0_g1_i1.p2 TRINITY_DN22452_c0_g1~~TRINITY_DN22452_c0_g1_i1.p2  ORF type:complete len:158 (+),score=26.97 TRINITY_DN22452_c0_g1_i1:199-672(+)